MNKMHMLCMRKRNNSSTESATEYVATFYLNDTTHGQRQQLRNLALANNRPQEWYKMKELLKRSPTLPRTNQTTASNDGNSPEKLTVNSALGDLTKRCRTAYVIKSATSWSPKTINWFLSREILAKAAGYPDASYSNTPPVASYSDVD
ncbi:hypothetical protein F511_22087 [Dorcoceras hygrometricum]|uniref:Uncharacterized protein n=1 Tax=Dorcoceras hygrometricum TaxID=472368 RepID=A0A2Z7CK41_9LAMI|nr:hypothetical protein F511_22087 [Dorcoceras hygrometricum]